jgi:nucleoredoxin
LRTGYSSNAILEELAKRHFINILDTTDEADLTRAGASSDLLAALKSGSYTVSSQEIARMQERKEQEIRRRLAASTDKERKFDTLHQAQLARKRAAEATRQPADQQIIYQQVKGDLVQFRNGAVSRFEDTELETKKYFLLYFSAHWCGPCRKFTPGLINLYKEIAAKHPEFELIFVSCDRSPFGMETYMRETNMPWPAIDFQKLREKEGIQKYAGKGIPDLVLVDNSGTVLADSYKGEQYLGPASVLQALNNILTNPPGKDIAQAR